MGLVLVDAHFHALRIHKEELELRGRLAQEKACEHGIEAHTLALACGACHKQMWHLCKIAHKRLACRVLAHNERECRAGFRKDCVFRYLAEIHHGTGAVGDDYAHGVRARHRSLDENGNSHERTGNVLGVAYKGAHRNARGRTQHVGCDHRPWCCPDKLCLDA